MARVRMNVRIGIALTLGLMLLGACEPEPPIEEIGDPILPPVDPVATAALGGAPETPNVSGEEGTAAGSDTIVVQNRGGLVERLPNTCKLENYAQYRGQTSDVLAAAGLDRPWRVVTPTTIVSQEYNPARLNFYTGTDDIIQRIACG